MDGRKRALESAIKKAGGQTALGAMCKVRQCNVWYWLHRSISGVPPQHVLTIEKHTGVSRHALRPDIFGPAPIEAKAA